jgi:superfamily II DNA/RNA helicase
MSEQVENPPKIPFEDFKLDKSLLEAIDWMGFKYATPIQQKAIPTILANRDLIGCAQTGTGKTAAYVLPILNKLIGKQDNFVDTLILVPTRELAVQIEQQIQGLSYFISVNSMAIYGGSGDARLWDKQVAALNEGCDIVVATPGKLLSHLKMGKVNFSKIKHLVLDEADRMLDMGFLEAIKQIISYLPEKRQNLLFSATMPQSIRNLAKILLHNPVEISLSISKPADGVAQRVFLTFDEQKSKLIPLLLREREHYRSIIIFTSAKEKINEIIRALNQAGFPSKGISSNLDQNQREEVLSSFRSKNTRILVATDVLSRGIDIKDIDLVINYDVPHDAEDYVHRIGRTARANTKGEAITLVNPKDMKRMHRIEKLIDRILDKENCPAEFGESPLWEVKSGSGKRKKSFNQKKKLKKPQKLGQAKQKKGA